jgi:hypothetical protein
VRRGRRRDRKGKKEKGKGQRERRVREGGEKDGSDERREHTVIIRRDGRNRRGTFLFENVCCSLESQNNREHFQNKKDHC